MRRVGSGLLLVVAVIVAALWWQSRGIAGFQSEGEKAGIGVGVIALVLGAIGVYAWITSPKKGGRTARGIELTGYMKD